MVIQTGLNLLLLSRKLFHNFHNTQSIQIKSKLFHNFYNVAPIQNSSKLRCNFYKSATIQITSKLAFVFTQSCIRFAQCLILSFRSIIIASLYARICLSFVLCSLRSAPSSWIILSH